jgi:NDP-sugar pyrophosphorylase family protein
VLDLLRGANVMALPLLDEAGRFQRVVHITDLAQREEHEGVEDARGFSFAVIMAGGEGARLRPLTDEIPKPMVDIGGVPVLGRLIERLSRARVRRVYLAVNYLSHVIEDHFGDGRDFGIEIRYLREEERLGTAGALSLLPEPATGPIIVMNGDIITTSDFSSLYAFHKTYQAHITVAAVDYRVNIPYGVIRADGPFITALTEKPSQRFLCNAGIYVLSPECLGLLQGVAYTNITDLIEACLERDLPVAVFPVHEYWSDIGTADDLEKARALFSGVSESRE